ncbi:MAG: LuxR C-terminal-related transcriptional regulator, partial [Thermodesulfovibrionales bacterium]
ELYILKGMAAADPLVKENFRLYKFQNWKETEKIYPESRDFFEKAAGFGLTKGYSHGTRLPVSSEGSMFSFAGDSVELLPRTERIIQILVPHLHQALLSVIHRRPLVALPHLTPREIEILKWIGAGKSSWEASIILGISESTVNFHIKKIMDKLSVGSRTQAIGIAVKAGLVDLGIP